MALYHMEIYLVAILLTVASLHGYKVEKYSLLMPNVRPNKADLYLCTPTKVNYTRNYYIVGFEPSASMNTAHHILLYGCKKPGSSKPVWDCGEMASSTSLTESASPCKQGSEIIYAWARNAPKLELPKDVGFKVGGDSPIQYLVLQVHYSHPLQDDNPDNSGVILHYTQRPLKKLAGVFLLGTGGLIPPNTIEHMESSCEINENKTIFPFAFRTHTHTLGKVVSGFRVRRNEQGIDEWTLLGKHDPLAPQMFYPIQNPVKVQFKDKLAARCTMESKKDTVTFIGATHEDEMCNFYLMYWTEDSSPLEQKYCFTQGPPVYYWTRDLSLNNIPEKEASTL